MNRANKNKRTSVEPVAPAPPLSWDMLRALSPQAWVKVLIILQLGLFAWQFSPALSTNGDNAKYLILGKALAEGHGYRQLFMPSEPIETQYPVIFPAFLGFAQALTENLVFPKIMVALCGILITLVCYYLFRSCLSYLLIPFLLLVVSSGFIAEYSLILMSEVPYLLATLLAFLMLEKSQAQPENKLLFWGTIAVSLLPVNIRSAGIAFSGAWIVANVLNRRYRYAVAHVVGLVAALALFRLLAPSSESYITHLLLRNSYEPEAGYVTVKEMALRVYENLGKYGSAIIRSSVAPFARPYPQFIGRLVSTVCVGAMLIGWVRNAFTDKRIISWYLLFYCGILVMWQPQWSSERFLVSVIPLLYLFMLYGFDAFLGFFEPAPAQPAGAFFHKLASRPVAPLSNRRSRVFWGCIIVLTFFNFQYQVAHPGEKKEPTPDWRNFYSCADWARINTPKDAIVLSRKPELFYVRAQRKGVTYPFTYDVDKIIEFMEKEGVTHVVHDNFAWTRTTAKYLYPVIAGHPDRFRVVYAVKDPDTFIMEFVKK